MQYIYLLQNNATKRTYVGRSVRPNYRFYQHMSALRGHRHNNELMQDDFDKYGEESFTVRIAEEAEHLTRTGREGEWMVKLKTYDKDYGYNYKDPYVLHWNGKVTCNVPS